MSIMEFEDLKKIWDTQNNEPMYAINETELHRSIRAKRNHTSRLSNINDIGLVIIVLLTSIILLLDGSGNIYDYLSVIALSLIGGYVLIGRSRRKQQEQHFEHSMLGDLDHAIANVTYEIKRNKTFVWWFLLPTAIPLLLNLLQPETPFWKWVVIPAAFVLAFVVTRWELNRKQLPRKRKLEALRAMLVKEEVGI